MNTKEGIMYRYRPGEDPQKVGAGNFQRLGSGPRELVWSSLHCDRYRVIDNSPLVVNSDGSVVLYAALDNRGGKSEPFFGVWVNTGADPVSFSQIIELVDHAVNNGTRSELFSVLHSFD
jgi:hypothetical protein